MAHTVLQLNKIYKSNAPLINNMVKAGSEDFRTLACYLTGASDGNNGMEQRAEKTFYCGIPKRRVKWTDRDTVAQVSRLIDENAVDLLVCQFRRSIPIGVRAARRSRRKPKVVAVLHGIVGGKVGLGRKLVNYFAFKGVNRIVSVSESGVADTVGMNIGLDPAKVVAIPNGLDCAPFLAPATASRKQVLPDIEPDRFVFAMVGRLAPVKNHAGVLQALASIADRFPKAHLVIADQGPLQGEIEALVAKLGLAGRVSLLGYRRDVPEILKHIDAYLMPSFREGFGLALAEAMVSGVPVITSHYGGMRELVPDEEYGFLVDAASIDSIATAMSRLLESSEAYRQRKIERARQRVLEHFTAERMASAYEDLYRQLLADG